MDYRQNVEMSLRDEPEPGIRDEPEPGIRDSTYFFSVCKPLAEKEGLNCPSEAAVCSAHGSLKDGWKVIAK